MTYKDVVPEDDSIWYLDSGASNHLSRHKHIFLDLKEIDSEFVSSGEASKVRVIGKGKIHFSRKDGKEGLIEDVYYVSEIQSNILSLGKLL